MVRKTVSPDLITMMSQPTTDLRFHLSMERGEVREAMGWSFVSRLERLANELMSKMDCPQKFWIIYSAKWDVVNRKIKELWQVDDKKPKNHLLGQVIYEIDKSGKAEFWALPLDVPVPESAYEGSNEYVTEGIAPLGNTPLSDQVFESI